MKILKFGGSSVRDAERIASVVEIVRRELAERSSRSLAVVVSALGGVTDELARAALLAAAGEGHGATLEGLAKRHAEIADTVSGAEERRQVVAALEAILAEIDATLRGVSLVRECSPRTQDGVLACGERLASVLVAAALRTSGVEAEACDARRLVVTDRRFGAADVLMEPTVERLRAHFEAVAALQVVTGFIAATAEGETTTLGRGGSDLTAALFGAVLGAESIELWTDVDGVMSADPRQVPDAFSLERLTYEELMELSHFGAKVVYPPSVLPARRSGIPLWIKNTLNPDFPGTLIEAGGADRGPVASSFRQRSPVTGVSSISEVALLRLEGDGMAGIPGTARRLFDALAREGINVILISQASSEHSICFAVDPRSAERARGSVEAEFAHDRAAGAINELIIEDHHTIIAVVGERMRERPGIAGRLFSALAAGGVNVVAIAQGSSELNISLVVERRDERRALRTVHDSFFRPDEASLVVFLVGSGRVGGELLDQLEAQASILAAELGLELRLGAVASSRHMLLDRAGLHRGSRPWAEQLPSVGEPTDLDALVEYVLETSGPRVLVDCTASDSIGELYPRLLAGGAAVVSANKKPFAGPLAALRRIHTARAPFGRGLYYEATVGAGLPVIQTLRALLHSGDRLLRIEGVFSGTLGYVLSAVREGSRFSDAVRRAHDLGYTEPDPRQDLSGMDVARKLLILAREAGLDLEQEQVRVEPLFDGTEVAGAPLEEFWRALPAADEAFAEQERRAANDGLALVYLARLEGHEATVGISSVGRAHPCFALDGTDNLFAFYTERYSETPLVVRGPGAGPAVTAGCVFADVLRAHAEAADPLVPVGRLFPQGGLA
jgi:aspartokinase/homoserine dehydrogenase 1